ncbi:PEP-CTERM sorting domain-containing protein [Methylomonas koyamae]|uniref:PEP-CTERM sorting domain-containing protein n=1 Tax=Methylomonas koyamae TaxID=702114 RepID=UPI0028734A90|nr:PEP-CTERM sorting domain-containing protein [Methylomonas koyamae]WNB75445.1 PEP-CTERM sorting domain-containing protein [Methylomonas koyamae]
MRPKIITLLATSLLASSMNAQAAIGSLAGKGYYTYGDANSYSLPLNGLEVMSGPGQIDVYTKLGLGANGQTGNPTAGMDDAFDTPQANNIDDFRMGAGNEPLDTGSWDRVGWWDASLSALHGDLDLALNSMIFFFANNETGGKGTDNLAAWARVELTQGNVLLGRFDLTNDPEHDGQGYGAPPASGGVPMGDPGAYTSNGAEPYVSDFLMSGGNVCVNSSGLIVNCSQPHVIDAEHNLGGDRAAYAIVFPELNALIKGLVQTDLANLSSYALHVNYRLGCGPEKTQAGGSFPTAGQGGNTECDPNYALNGGDEKVFIGTESLLSTVPEPSSLALLALGPIYMGWRRRRAL